MPEEPWRRDRSSYHHYLEAMQRLKVQRRQLNSGTTPPLTEQR
jgi:hypothetical protein